VCAYELWEEVEGETPNKEMYKRHTEIEFGKLFTKKDYGDIGGKDRKARERASERPTP